MFGGKFEILLNFMFVIWEFLFDVIVLNFIWFSMIVYKNNNRVEFGDILELEINFFWKL